jgi:signal transduction histidine kinase
MLATFATQAAIALELAEHREQAERVAVFEDRDRIARDLHDLVIQRLYATGMSLQGTVSLIAGASKVDVSLRAADEVALVVADNGSGFKDASRRSGLGNLEERATQLGGSMHVESVPGAGTTLSWRIPLTRATRR